MRSGLFLLFCSLNWGPAGNAQQVEWQNSLGGTDGEKAFSIEQQANGTYLVAGFTLSNNGNVSGNHGLFDCWLVCLSNSGTILWQKCLGGSNNDAAHCLQPTPDGGCIMAGVTASNDGDVSGNHGLSDYWVVKLDSTASIQWQKCLGGTGSENASAIQQTADGGYVVAGWTGSNDGDVSDHRGLHDYWVVKLDNTGSIQWRECFGGSNNDEAYAVQQTYDAGYVVAGWSASSDGDVSGNHGQHDFWVIKLSGLGVLEWQKSLGGTGIDWAYSVQQTLDSGFVAAGWSNSSDGDVSGNHGEYDFWVVKLSVNGKIQWQKSLGGTFSDAATSIRQTADGGYIVAGAAGSDNGDVSGNHGLDDYWVVKLDASGSIQWQKCFGGTNFDDAYSIVQSADGGYAVAGISNSINGDVSGNKGSWDYWVVKLNDTTLATSIAGWPQPGADLSIYPNPALNQITMAATEPVRQASVYDLTGIKLVERVFETPLRYAAELDVTGLRAGLYFLLIHTASGTASGRFMKHE